MTPYYQDDLVTIYHGDWRVWLAGPWRDGRDAVAVIVTDPPYGIAWRQHGGGQHGKSRNSRRHEGISGDTDTSERDEMLATMPVLLRDRGTLLRDRRQPLPTGSPRAGRVTSLPFPYTGMTPTP